MTFNTAMSVIAICGETAARIFEIGTLITTFDVGGMVGNIGNVVVVCKQKPAPNGSAVIVVPEFAGTIGGCVIKW